MTQKLSPAAPNPKCARAVRKLRKARLCSQGRKTRAGGRKAITLPMTRAKAPSLATRDSTPYAPANAGSLAAIRAAAQPRARKSWNKAKASARPRPKTPATDST